MQGFVRTVAVVALAVVVCAEAFVARDDSGTCGDATYTFTSATHHLAITGTGALKPTSTSPTTVYPWTDYLSEIYSVSIAEGITDIKTGLAGSALRSVVLPESITAVLPGAFTGCSSLVNVTLGSQVTSVGRESFSLCTSLKNINLPDGVTFIGDRAFYKCFNLTSIKLPPQLTLISDYTFFNCTSLLSIELPSGVTEVMEFAFRHCRSLKSVTFSESLNAIGESSFGSCKSLERVVIPAGLTYMMNNAFQDCSSLMSVTFLGTREVNSYPAFGMCNMLDIVCVPAAYEGNGFGNKTVYKSDNCEQVVKQTNKCYGMTVTGTEISVWQRDSAKKWENQTNGCEEFKCDNEIGLVSWGKCNSTSGNTMMCLNGTCQEEGQMMQEYTIEISLVEPFSATSIMSLDVLGDLHDATEYDTTNWIIGLETNEQGNVVQIVVVGDFDSQTANGVQLKLNEIERGENCQYGILCNMSGVRIVTEPTSSHAEPSSSHTGPSSSHTEPSSSHTGPSSSHTGPSSSHTEPSSHTSSVKSVVSSAGKTSSGVSHMISSAPNQYNSRMFYILAMVLAFLCLFH